MDRFVSRVNVTLRKNDVSEGEQGRNECNQRNNQSPDMFDSSTQNSSTVESCLSSPNGSEVDIDHINSLVLSPNVDRSLSADVHTTPRPQVKGGVYSMYDLTSDPSKRGSPTLKNSSISDSGISSPIGSTGLAESLVAATAVKRNARADGNNTPKPHGHNFVAPISPSVANDSTPRSPNTRTCWTPYPLKVGSTYQISIFCRSSNGKVGPFTSAKSAAKVRPCWAPLLKCGLKLVKDARSSIIKSVFEITNADSETKDFRVDTLFPAMFKKTKAGESSDCLLGEVKESFSNKLSHLVVKSPKLLSLYLSLVSVSQGFCNYDSSIYLPNGLKSANSADLDLIVELGGSLGDYELFLQSAKDSALDIGQVREQGYRVAPAVKNKMITDFFLNINDNPKKMSRSELVKFNYNQMLSEEGGLEKSTVNSYVDWSSIPLSKLELSSENHLLIVPSKVDGLVTSFLDRYDPAQIVFSVVPSDFDTFNKGSYEGKYSVIHGRHRLLALQKLQEHGRLGELPNFPGNGNVQCYIMKISAASNSNYFTIRANDLSSSFQSCTTFEELFYVYRGLLKSMNPEDCLKTIQNVCYSRHTNKLIKTLKKFQ